ncbi:hypothetical protein [Methanocorpusculum sp.]
MRHLVISPPPNLYDAWKDYDSSKMTREVTKHMQKFFPRIIASAYVYHPYRIQTDIISQLRQYRYENPGRTIQIVKREKEDITINYQETRRHAKNDLEELATYGTFGFWEARKKYENTKLSKISEIHENGIRILFLGE